MKKIIAAVIGVATVLSMAGCASVKTREETTPSSPLVLMDKHASEITMDMTLAEAAQKLHANGAVSGIVTDEIKNMIRLEIGKALYEGENKEVFDSVYQYFVNGNLAEVFVPDMDMSGNGFEDLKIYTVDALAGKLIAGNEIVELAGMAGEGFSGIVKEICVKLSEFQMPLDNLSDTDNTVLGGNFGAL